MERLLKKIKEKNLKIGILGLGYVGLLTVSEILANNKQNKDLKIYGFDKNKDVVEKLSKLKSETYSNYKIYQDINLQDIEKAIKSGTFKIEKHYDNHIKDFYPENLYRCDVIIVCINIGLDEQYLPLLNNLDKAANIIRRALSERKNKNEAAKGTDKNPEKPLIILESTTYPGASQHLIELLKKSENNKISYQLNEDFYYGCSPQRFNFGDSAKATSEKFDLCIYKNIPKLLGTCYPDCRNNSRCCNDCGKLVKRFYEEILNVKYLIEEKSLQTVELTKIFENIYRAVNIALVNELKMLCDKMNINIWEAIEAAETKPFGYNAFYPGPGIGGRCIPIDPIYLSWKARKHKFFTKFIELAIRINERMVQYTIDQFTYVMNEKENTINESKIFVIGLGYKENTYQIMDSPAIKLIEKIMKLGGEITYFDPLIKKVSGKELFPNLYKKIKKTTQEGIVFYKYDKDDGENIGNDDCESIKVEDINSIFKILKGILILHDLNILDEKKGENITYHSIIEYINQYENKVACLDTKNCLKLTKKHSPSEEQNKEQEDKSFLNLKNKIERKEVKVGVIGLGYVGFPLLMRIAELGFNVVGFDKQEIIIQGLKKDDPVSPIENIDNESIKKIKAKKTVEFVDQINNDSLRSCEIFIFCIGTPIDKYRNPNLESLQKAVEDFKEYILKKNGKKPLVILESTTYPGCTKELFKPNDLYNGDFFLVHSPERINPGEKNADISSIIKIVGGFDENSTNLGYCFYKKLIDSEKVKGNFDPNTHKQNLRDNEYKQYYETALDFKFEVQRKRLAEINDINETENYETVRIVSNLETAEMTKLLENVYRSVNIALSDELLMLCSKMDINFWKVVDLARTKPFGFEGFYPGPGFGGHCIPVDPFYLSWKAREYNFPLSFIEWAGQINHQMIDFTVSNIFYLLNQKKIPLKKSKILFIGVAYKNNVGDVRESTATHIIKKIKKKHADVMWFDPFVKSQLDKEGSDFYKNNCKELEALQTINQFHCVVLHTAHNEENIDYKTILEGSEIILDCRNYYNTAQLNELDQEQINKKVKVLGTLKID